MQCLELGLKLRVGSCGGFENGEGFRRSFDRTLPAVDGLDSWDEIDTSRQLLFNQRCANLSRYLVGRKGAKHDPDFICIHPSLKHRKPPTGKS